MIALSDFLFFSPWATLALPACDRLKQLFFVATFMSWKQLKITRIWQILLAFMAFSFFVWTFTFELLVLHAQIGCISSRYYPFPFPSGNCGAS